MSTDRIPMSKEGYEKKKAQLDHMKNEDMPRIAEQIALARGFGDLSENAEFDAAVEAQGMLQARINDLQNMLGQAYIVEKSTVPTDRVVYGSKVRVLDLDLNEEEDFILVGPGEEDYDQNKILLTSPIGQGLVGKMVGEQVEVQIPRGVLKLKIVEIGVAVRSLASRCGSGSVATGRAVLNALASDLTSLDAALRQQGIPASAQFDGTGCDQRHLATCHGVIEREDAGVKRNSCGDHRGLSVASVSCITQDRHTPRAAWTRNWCVRPVWGQSRSQLNRRRKCDGRPETDPR